MVNVAMKWERSEKFTFKDLKFPIKKFLLTLNICPAFMQLDAWLCLEHWLFITTIFFPPRNRNTEQQCYPKKKSLGEKLAHSHFGI